MSPFAVCAFNRNQFEVLASEKAKKGELTGFLDGSGGVVKKPSTNKKRILYYPFTIPVMPEQGKDDIDEKNCRILPFTEMVGQAHDQLYIGIWLKIVKRKFCELYPNLWPILTYAVTDFSLAIINAINEDWNRLTMREYLQVVYDNLSDLPKLKARYTLILLCCSHLCNNMGDDVNNCFVTDHSRKFLKEILAGMYNITKLHELKEFWRNLSILLRSKYYTTAVRDATNFLVEYLVEEKPTEYVKEEDISDEEWEDEDEEDDLKLKNKILPDYKDSPFYKDFIELEYDKDKEFLKENGSDELNEFYSVNFADLMMRKYIPILPLWTCLVVKKRKSNGRVEVLFKIIKKRLHDLARRRGNLPLKCGRFLKEMREFINEIIIEYELDAPRVRMCTPKRKNKVQLDGDKILKKIRKEQIKLNMKKRNVQRLDKKNRKPFRGMLDTIDEEMEIKRFDQLMMETPDDIITNPELMNNIIDKIHDQKTVYSSTPKRSNFKDVNESTPKRRRFNDVDTYESTPKRRKSNDVDPYESTPKRRKFNDIDLNDPDPHENWKGSVSKSSHTYFDFQYLRKCKKTGFHKSDTISKKPGRKSHKLNKFKNCLKDDPQVYMNLKHPFSVAYFGKYIVRRDDYITLSGTQWLSDALIEYIYKTFESQSEEMNKSIQFEVSRSSLLCYPNTRNLRLPKIEKKILIAAMLRGRHYTLFIINTIQKTFSYLDPANPNPAVTETLFKSFKDFIVRHNAAYPQCILPNAEWTIKTFQYPLQKDGFNCGVFVIYYAKEFFEKKIASKISEQFCPKTFREYLQHYVLKSSVQMRNRCVICSMLIHKTEQTSVKCDNATCSRFTHLECLKEQIAPEELDNKFFVCYICRD